MSRSTLCQRVDALIERGLLRETRGTASTGGRPPRVLTFNSRLGFVLAVDLDVRGSRLAVTDLGGAVLAEATERLRLDETPEAVVEQVAERFGYMLDELGANVRDVLAIGAGVSPRRGQGGGGVTASLAADGWNEASLGDRLRAHYDVTVLVDSSVSLAAAGEHALDWSHAADVLFVSVGSEIACGILTGGRIHRGVRGAAGDIAHTAVRGHDDVVCQCGNMGCLEAVAGAQALARQLTDQGVHAVDAGDVVRLVRSGHPLAVRAMRRAGRSIGEVMAVAVDLIAPEVIVLGGELGEVHEHLLAGLREEIFRHARPLVTRDLRTVPSRLGLRAGVLGAALMSIEQVLAPEAIDRALETPAVLAT